MKSSDSYRLGAWAGNQDKVDQALLKDPDYAAGVQEGLHLADIGLWVEKPVNNGCKSCKTRWTEK